MRNIEIRDLMKPTIAYHIGGHGTVSYYLNKLFKLNRLTLEQMGVVTPIPSRYRQVEAHFFSAHRDAPFSEEDQELFFDMITDVDRFERLVLSYNAFLSNRQMAVTENGLYPSILLKMHFLRDLYFDFDIDIFFEIESLATFPFTLYEKIHDDKKAIFNSAQFTNIFAAESTIFRWKEIIRRISVSLPKAKITVFCAEDVPIVWPSIVQKMTGSTSVFDFNGIYGLPLYHMKKSKRRPFLRSMKSMPPKSIDEYTDRIGSNLGDTMKVRDVSEQYYALGWGAKHIEYFNSVYEDDIEAIQRIPNVEVL